MFALPDQDVYIPAMLANHPGCRKHTYRSVLSNQKGRLEMKMKIVAITILIGVVATLTGCSQGISIGPGAYGVPEKDELSRTRDTVSQTMPLKSLNQRKTKALFLGKSWGKYFREKDAVKVVCLPGGEAIDPGSPVTTLRLKVAEYSVPKRNAYSPLGISGWE